MRLRALVTVVVRRSRARGVDTFTAACEVSEWKTVWSGLADQGPCTSPPKLRVLELREWKERFVARLRMMPFVNLLSCKVIRMIDLWK